ncbi:serine/threonine protein phosphatase 2A 57 kDa regulatory subunit B' beta isoform-like [Neltuma alba]|uniref:serine/threonine protein phosphatase 2A 57 kDa regulatory subunit B' beta isoform-like n=1 Tax=Neltuma alba TaxID=207710 RepID=UPI0010A4BA01|nr:serine/threonine protein phosphatase 2A 57 kDa regulatory subunit B' beta isoform-like [Prosopis alba]
MFNKFRKRGTKKSSKSKINGYSLDGDRPLEVFVNHESRTTTVLAPAVAPPISAAVELLPPVREVAVSERASVLLRKIQLCCYVFDYSDNLKSVREKEIKRRTLNELLDIIQSGSLKFDEVMQEQLIGMVSANIFRCLPPASHENTGTETVNPEEDERHLNLLWPHLQLVYEILLMYIVSFETETKIAKRYIDHTFVLKLLDLFDSEDPRERERLKTILHRIYGKFMLHRPFIRRVINNIFYRFIFETERHNGIAELLEFQGSVINGLSVPMKEENRLFLFRALIPLHKPTWFSTYYQPLSYCMTQFVEKDYRLAEYVIRGLLKYWPVTNCQKEVLFLAELEEILEATQSAEFKLFMVPLFRQIGRCLKSPHFQVAERTLGLWNNGHIVSLIAENRDVIFPLILEAVEKNMKGHWNEAVHGLSANVRGMLLEMDSKLYEGCLSLYSEKEAMAVDLEAQRQLTWKKLEAVAALAGTVRVHDHTVLVN